MNGHKCDQSRRTRTSKFNNRIKKLPIPSGVDFVTKSVMDVADDQTYDWLSAKSGVSAEAIRSYRRGTRIPNVATLAALAESVGLEISVHQRDAAKKETK